MLKLFPNLSKVFTLRRHIFERMSYQFGCQNQFFKSGKFVNGKLRIRLIYLQSNLLKNSIAIVPKGILNKEKLIKLYAIRSATFKV